MTREQARERFARERVARIATVGPGGAAHVIPVCFALEHDTLWWAVDAKPKRTTELRRLLNIRANPSVSLLVDVYDEDWTRLWWVRADGRAREVEDDRERARALEALIVKYPQYRQVPPPGPVVQVTIEAWSAWSAEETVEERS